MTADTLTPRAPLPVPPPPAPDLSTTAEVTPAGPPRRAVALLAVGLAVLLLAVGGIVRTLADRGDDGDTGGATGSGPGATSSSAPHTTPAAQEAPGSAGAQGGNGSTDDGDAAGKAGNGGSGHSSTSKPPPQTVTVYLTSVRGSYEGSCPPLTHRRLRSRRPSRWGVHRRRSSTGGY